MRRPVLVLLAVPLVALSACGGGQQSNDSAEPAAAGAELACEVKEPIRISIATGNTTGVYFPLGGALAEQLSKATNGTVKATAAETGASVQNIEQLVAGDFQVAFSLSDTAADAVAGKGSFTKAQPVKALARIHDNVTQVVVRKDAGIKSLADFKGKTVSTGSPKSGTEVIANRLIAAAGLKPEDVKAQRLDLTKTVDGMKDGSIDALVWSGGIPTPGLTDLFTTAGKDVTMLDISNLQPEMEKLNKAYEKGTVPAGTYGSTADTPTITVANVLLARDDMDPELACVVSKTLIASAPALIAVNAAAKQIKAETAKQTGAVPEPGEPTATTWPRSSGSPSMPEPASVTTWT